MKIETVVIGECKHRVRKYVSEVVSQERIQWSQEFTQGKDAAKQRRFSPIGSRIVKKTVGRNPGPVQYETWVTASLGRFTGAGPTLAAAHLDLMSKLPIVSS